MRARAAGRVHELKRPSSLPRQLCNFAVTLLFLLISSGYAYGQTAQCSLNLADLPAAPELLGFQLGMTKEQVKVRIPQVVFGKNDEFGVSKTTINPYFDPRIDKSTFENVRSISLDFLDNHLTSLWIGYDSSFNVASVDEFVKRISQSLHLPAAWVSWRTRGQQLRCKNFQVTVTLVADGPSFRLLDTGAEDVLAARRETKEEQESKVSEASEGATEILGDKKNKIYYAAGCQPTREIAEPDRVIFKDAEAADKAGFKAAKACQQ